ncbi:ATP-binding cassette sub-family C member 3 [Halotydeus destructor]|nr:ATP-binding cassette sub-family C member 3 [Halotydeus destructor]
MDGFCRTDFWDYNITWNTENPDFTPCFHETALVWAPCAFLWLLSPFEFFRIRKTTIKASGVPKWTLLAKIKILFAILLGFLSSLEMVNALANISERSPAEYYSPFIKVATFSYASLLISLNHKKAIPASGALFQFWLLVSISSIVTLKSILFDLFSPNASSWNLDNIVYACKIVEFLLIIAEFALCCFSESFESGQSCKKPSPEWRASFLGRIMYTWFDSLVSKGYREPIVMDDIYDISEEFKSAPIYEKFCEHWSYPEKPHIMGPLLKTFWPRLVGAALLKLVASVLTFVSPSVLNYILLWLPSDEPYWHGFFYAFLMFAAPLFQSILSNQYEYMVALSGMQMKTAVISALHRKSLKLSPTAKTQFTTGQIVNLMSVDSQAIVNYVSFANNWWVAPLQIIIAMKLLWQQLGIATLAGISIMVLLIPINGYMTTRMRTTHRALMKEKDKRSKLMTEIIDGMKVLKMYAWETSLAEQVKGIRSNEVFQLQIQAKLMSFIFFAISCAPVFVSILSFLAFTMIDVNNVLDPSKTFVSLALFNIIRMPLAMVPFLISAGTAFLVAKKRIDAYLGCDELNPDDIGREEDEKKAIEIKEGAFSWEGKGESTLSEINLRIEKGKLVAVVGTVGSGKSSLVSALLGDMEKIKGKVNISGSVAYVPQQAWIQNATVKQNIVFTGIANQAKYEAVIASCALKADLKILEAGDKTEIGEKGINLSGGQKQRISLARAVYASRDIYLLDDPLSAVDSHVGKHIFDEVIGPKGVLKDTTRILVTHKVALLPHVDEIVVMKDGRISEHGSYHELLQRKGAFADFLIEYLVEEKHEDEDLEDIEAMLRPELERRLSMLSVHSVDKTPKDNVKNRTKSTVSNVSSEKMEHKQSILIEDIVEAEHRIPTEN